MRTRLISLLLALVMLLSLCMTSCSGGEEAEATGEEAEEVQRPNIALTIYAITNSSTTAEGLAAVEEKISNYCVAKYKTAIDLRFYTEAEYQKALDDMYAKFAEQEAAAQKAKEEAAKKAKEEAAYKATLTPEERREYEQQKRLEKKAQEEAEEQKKKEEAELIEQGKDVAVIKDVQMDILYIPGQSEYYDWTDEGLLLDLNAYLTGVFKNIKDYVYPSYITAATYGGGIYGIPNNQAVNAKETFFVVNQALVEKYAVDFSQVRSISDLNDVFAQIKAQEAGVTPIYGDFAPEGLVFYDGIDTGNTVCAFFDTLPGGRFTSENVYSALNPNSSYSTAFVDYCALKANYRANGYLSDTNENFFLSVQELTEEERAAWAEKGYATVLYKGAEFTTQNALDVGLFGISKYCEKPDRAMEIIQLLSNDPEFRNLLAFGVKDVNYIETAGKDNVITILNDSYSMDFFKTGNTLLGYVPDTMAENYVEYAKEKNRNSRISPFLGYLYDWTAASEQQYVTAFAEWKTGIADRYEKLMYGDSNYLAIITEIYDEIYNNTEKKYSMSYKDFQSNCNFRSSSYKAYATKLVELDKTLHVDAAQFNPISE